MQEQRAETAPDFPGQKNPEYKTKFGPETDLMAMRVDAWKMHIGVKHHGKLV